MSARGKSRSRFPVSVLALTGLVGLLSSLAAQTRPLTPRPAASPRINGPGIYGCRPGSPFAYAIPATGERPIAFAAEGLPRGLRLDVKTGRITGTVSARGTYPVVLRATNARGAAEKKLRIVCGDTIALTPPMGWSSWYMAYTGISDAMIRSQAEAMVSSGLADHGYTYINIDDGWNIKLKSSDPAVGGEPRDAAGNLRPNRNFPDMKALCDHVHSLGLKIGIYISPGPATCAEYAGSYGHEEQDARQFAAWGFDFLKYDWCYYGDVAPDKSLESLKKPYILMGGILARLGRDMVYNLCQYGMDDVWEWGSAGTTGARRATSASRPRTKACGRPCRGSASAKPARRSTPGRAAGTTRTTSSSVISFGTASSSLRPSGRTNSTPT
jgi:alpha-galactosidase